MMTALSIAGAVTVLVAFVLSNLRRMDTQGKTYAFLNFLGTGLLAVTVIDPLNIGVLVVESVWSLFSLYLLVVALRRASSHRCPAE
jgi:hypothetical protein